MGSYGPGSTPEGGDCGETTAVLSLSLVKPLGNRERRVVAGTADPRGLSDEDESAGVRVQSWCQAIDWLVDNCRRATRADIYIYDLGAGQKGSFSPAPIGCIHIGPVSY